MDTDTAPRSVSQAPAPRKTRRGFNLIEAAIVLGVVGLVIGGIWVAASAVQHKRFEQKFMEGFVVLKDNAQKYIKQGQSCLVGSFHYTYPEFYTLIQPKQWTEIEVAAGGKFAISMRVYCVGDSTAFPNEKYLSVVFWNPSNYPYLCNNIFPKMDALCSRSGDCYLDMFMINYHCERWPGMAANPEIQIRIGRN